MSSSGKSWLYSLLGNVTIFYILFIKDFLGEGGIGGFFARSALSACVWIFLMWTYDLLSSK